MAKGKSRSSKSVTETTTPPSEAAAVPITPSTRTPRANIVDDPVASSASVEANAPPIDELVGAARKLTPKRPIPKKPATSTKADQRLGVAAPAEPASKPTRRRTPARATAADATAAPAAAPALPPAAAATRRRRKNAAARAIEPPPETVPTPRDESLSILMVASEVVPFAKTGGLADVAAALPAALGRLGHRVRVAMPRYRGIAVRGRPIVSFDMRVGPRRLAVSIYEAPLGERASVWLVDIPALFDREGLYGLAEHDHPDNPLRFAALARAALDGAIVLGIAPDVVHAHDWQAGLAPVYLKTRYYQDPLLGGVPCVFTIHNIAYRGQCDAAWLPALDLGWELNSPGALEYWGDLSFLKGGINFSDKITTVSRRYADEILTPEFGLGFEGIVAGRRADLVGILNGIDTEAWNPAADPHLPAPYTADDLTGKQAAKRALLQAYGLPSEAAELRVPVVGMVSRMVAQKGLDLIAEAAAELPYLGTRFVVLGTGEPQYETMWRNLAAQFPDRIAVRIGFDEGLSHVLEAGSDIFLMPSRFEPCGLNQMYSLRYGTLPLVRATGGLDDTVENYDPYTGSGNGFKFWEASGAALAATLRWALRVYENPEVWQRLQRTAMSSDFSWNRSAREYVATYELAMTAVGRARKVAAEPGP